MELSDYKAARDFIEKKALDLMEHEKKAFATVGFPIQNYSVYEIETRTFYAVSTNIFRGILNSVLLEAMIRFPLNFGNGNAVSVIHALNKTQPFYGRLKNVVRILRTENFSYIVENDGGNIADRILRLDLFRKLDPVKGHKKKYEFTGGVFHALKHFSQDGKPLSTGTDINDLVSPNGIIPLIIKAFFVLPGEFSGESKYISFLDLDEKSQLKFVFYREQNSKVYFLSTIHKMSKKGSKSKGQPLLT